MGFLYLVEQQHTVGRLANGIGEQSSVLVTYISRRRTYQLGHRVLLGIFAHVKAHQADTQLPGQRACHFCLAHSSRPYKEERGQWFVVIKQSRTRHLHSFHHLADGFILSVYTCEHAG